MKSQQLHRSPRLYVKTSLSPGKPVHVEKDQAHYLGSVLRLKVGDAVRLFNGHDGEWLCSITATGKRSCVLHVVEHQRRQTPPCDLHYLFAPLKHSRLDYIVQKATELGASALRPVVTAHTNVARVKTARMIANAIEAAEQCNLLGVPQVHEPVSLDRLVCDWDRDRCMIFCDENAEVTSPLAALNSISPGPLAVLIGPEGGFSNEERDRLMHQPFVRTISLGTRTMRADTAGTVALALVQAVLGDQR